MCFIDGDTPIAYPVSFKLHRDDEGSSIVVRTGPDSLVANYAGPASFEVDEIDVEARTAWSVLMRGAVPPHPRAARAPRAGAMDPRRSTRVAAAGHRHGQRAPLCGPRYRRWVHGGVGSRRRTKVLRPGPRRCRRFLTHTTTERGATVVPCGSTLASPGTHGPSSWSSNVIGAQPALTVT